MKDASGKNTRMGQVNPQPIRPQKPVDGTSGGGGTFTPGMAPKGGFQGVWNFGPNRGDTKNSPTSKPDKR